VTNDWVAWGEALEAANFKLKQVPVTIVVVRVGFRFFYFLLCDCP
jgi:hypothetical protein